MFRMLSTLWTTLTTLLIGINHYAQAFSITGQVVEGAALGLQDDTTFEREIKKLRQQKERKVLLEALESNSED